jgi:hypothetical protein
MKQTTAAPCSYSDADFSFLRMEELKRLLISHGLQGIICQNIDILRVNFVRKLVKGIRI